MITLFTSHFAYITIDSQHVTKSGQSAKGAHRSEKKQQLESVLCHCKMRYIHFVAKNYVDNKYKDVQKQNTMSTYLELGLSIKITLRTGHK